MKRFNAIALGAALALAAGAAQAQSWPTKPCT